MHNKRTAHRREFMEPLHPMGFVTKVILELILLTGRQGDFHSVKVQRSHRHHVLVSMMQHSIQVLLNLWFGIGARDQPKPKELARWPGRFLFDAAFDTVAK
jgi:hypothetical protein